MTALPVPPEIYFSDFAFDIKTFKIYRHDTLLHTVFGLDNIECGKTYIHFQLPVDVQSGDILENSDCRYLVTEIAFDTYNGSKALLKAYVVATL